MKQGAWIAIVVVVVVAISAALIYNTNRSTPTPGPAPITQFDSPNNEAQIGGTMQIGVILSLTGKGATYGQRSLNGMQMAVRDLDEQEPHLPFKVELVVEDSNSQAGQALSAFLKLTESGEINVVVGLVMSDETLTCAPAANERKKVLLTPAAGSNDIALAGDFVFRNREKAALQSEAVAKVCYEMFPNGTTVILHSNAANGISYRDSFLAAFEALGGTIAESIGYNEGKNDYRSELTQIRSLSPQAVYLAGLDNELGLILKQGLELGIKVQYFASAGAVSDKLLEIAGTGAEGMICGRAPFDVNSTDPRVVAFANKYEQAHGEQPDFVAANSYDAIMILAEVFSQGAATGEEIRDALYGIKGFSGVGGVTTFDSDGEVTKPIELVKAEGERFVSFVRD